MKKLLAACLCILTFSHCNNKVYSLDNLPNQFIELGSYGGFTGIAETFHIFPNGQTILENSLEGSTELAKKKPKAFKNLVKNLKEINFSEIDLDNPGNLNYFIRLKTKKTDKKVLWSDSSKVPEGLKDFYRNTLKEFNQKATD